MEGITDSLYNGTWWDTSTDTPVYDFVRPVDVFTQAVEPTTTPVNDQWTGFFQGAASALVNYGIQKDAAGNRVNIQPNGYNAQQAMQQRTYATQAAPGNGLMLLLIGAAVFLAVK